MSGYAYGDSQPVEECPCCGDEAHAEFCDIGVGFQQISPYHCFGCGATEGEGPPFNPDGTRSHGWSVPPRPSERGETVTGHYVNPKGHVFETTWKDGHAEFVRRRGTSQDALRHDGWIRVTNLEGFAISLPRFVTPAAARALREVVEGVQARWGLPWVTTWDDQRGREMSLPGLMATIARVPREAPLPEVPPAQEEMEAAPGLGR